MLLLFLAASLALAAPALDLSNYLSSPAAGRAAARVTLPAPFSNLESYSGLFELSPGSGRFTFFWFFRHPSPSAPVVTWLQGGPGASSLFGLFGEHGPFYVDANQNLVARSLAWTNFASMLYIDNPVGVGFSRTNNASGFVQDETQIGEDLLSFISQFYQIFPTLLPNPLFVAGESYGGKYVPSMAYAIARQIASGHSSVNLRGILIGDGAFDPATQFTNYADLVFSMGFASLAERSVIASYDARIAALIAQQDWKGAFAVFDEELNGDFFGPNTYFHNITGLSDYFNMLSPPTPVWQQNYPTWLQTNRDLLHVGDGAVFWDYNATVEFNLKNDWMQGIVPKLTYLLANYSVLLYHGQLDVILGAPVSLKAIAKLQWGGAAAFAAARKKVWRPAADPSSVAGYVLQSVQPNGVGLTHATIRLAGHVSVSDAPEFTYDMAMRFIFNKGWN